MGLPSVRTPDGTESAPGDDRPKHPRGAWAVVLAFAGVFAVASIVGRLTVPANTQVALVWPSSGVAFVWFVVLHVDSRFTTLPRAASGVLVLAVSSTVSVRTGASTAIGLTYAAAALVSAWSGAVVYVRWCGEPNGALVHRRSLRVLCLAAVISAGLGACVVGAGSLLVPPVDGEALVLWTLRNTTAVVIVGSIGLRWRFPDPHRLELTHPGPIALTIGATAVSAVIVFRPGQSWPLEFLLIAVATSAATLLTVQWTTIYLLALAAVTVVANLSGAGPFALPDRFASSALVQAFLTALSYSAIGLALEHDLRTRDHEQVLRSREAEREQSELLASLYSMMSEAVVVVGESGAVTYSNAAAEPFLAGGRLSSTAVPPDVHAGIEAALRGESPPPGDVELPDSGRILSLRVHALVHRGTPQALVVLTDVTSDRLEHRHLKSFAGAVAHDLRAPLASMSTWAQLLEDEVSDTAVDLDPTPIHRINSSTERMATLINDVLAFSLAGDGPVHAEVVDLGPLAWDVVREELEAHAEPARVDVDMPHAVRADPTLVRQLLSNYVGNALKYARAGAVPEARISSQLTGDGFVRIAVQDRGIGLPAGEEELVFEEFHRAPQHALAYDGTGLGLAICRRIAERHGGRAWAASRPGGGACFFATFPGEPPQADG